MVNNWFFSNSAEVIGPFTLGEAKLYVTENPNVYGWHPTFVHWKPVSYIDEFSRILPPVVQVSTIHKEVSDEFIAKQKKLENRLATVDSGINNTEFLIENLSKEINQYKLLTQNLSPDVKDAVNNIESKYTNLKRQLSQIKETINIANNEMLVTVDDFNKINNANDVSVPPTNYNASQHKDESKKLTLVNTVDKLELVEEELVEEEFSGVPQPEKVDAQAELEDNYTTSDYIELYKKINSQKAFEPKQFYRGSPVEAPDKVEEIKKHCKTQRMYRGVPILGD